MLKALVPDHPRVGGEHTRITAWSYESDGSSPRGRGTRKSSSSITPAFRIIPAWAGNTVERYELLLCFSDHPRVGGEHNRQQWRSQFRDGSSPRGRGTQAQRRLYPPKRRIIPAWAGNTCHSVLTRARDADHPRVGGEHVSAPVSSPTAAGSSPRGRGTPSASHCDLFENRIIPAWAGNTRADRARDPPLADHPRVGGEH